MKYSILLFLLFPFVFSCKVKKESTTQQTPSTDTIYVENPETGELTMIIKNEQASINGKWQLQILNGNSDSELKRVSMQINESDKSVSGNDACNQYNGPLIILQDRQIEFGRMVSSTRACMVPAKYATLFYNTLPLIKTYSATKEILQLRDEEGTVKMQFEKRE